VFFIRIVETSSTNLPEITTGVDVPYFAELGEIEVILESCFGSPVCEGLGADPLDIVTPPPLEDEVVVEGVGVALADAEGDADADGLGLGEEVVTVNDAEATEADPVPAAFFAATVTVHVP
jgi:hypothetical protein